MFKKSLGMHTGNKFPISFETENPDPDCPRKNEKVKKFWSFVKSFKKDAFGITTLRETELCVALSDQRLLFY